MTRWRRGFAALAYLVAAMPVGARAQITTDGSLPGTTAHALTGPNYAITANLGLQMGPNLFHSFGVFNVNTGETATFSGPTSVANIIARVTGGSVSNINGTITSSIPGSNLFLINPAGLMFGPSAVVNVPGAFHATTADYLRFTDDTVFSASTPTGSTFSTQAPQAFGFLSTNPGAALSVTGSQLTPAGGSAFTQISLIGSAGGVALNGAAIQTPSGIVHIASIAGAGEIGVSPTDLASLTATSFGPVSLSSGTTIDASGTPAGAVYIRAGVLTADASVITSNHSGAGTGGGITLIGTTSITLSTASDVEIDNNGTGSPGSILLQGGSITMSGGSTILSQNYSSGPGASITVNGTDMSLTDGSQVTSSAFATGPGGNVAVAASGSVTIDGTLAAPSFINTGFGTMVQPGASGNAGNITVSVADTLTIIEGGAISSETGESGNAGNITVTAGTITTDDAIAPIPGGIFSLVDSPSFFIFLPFSDTASGNGGNVSVQAASITITGSAQIGTFTYGSGNAGNVVINGTAPGGTILVDGSSTAGLFTGIFSQSFTDANAGSVLVQGTQITLQGNGEIATQGYGAGAVGNVTINAGTLTADASETPGLITGANTFVTDGNTDGSGAAIIVTAAQITLTNGGTIDTLTGGMGQSGAVAITTTGPLTVSAGGQISSTTNSAATGNAGPVTVTAPSLSLTNTGEIGSFTYGAANAGVVTVTAGSINIAGQGATTLTGIASDAEAGSTGNGGSVNVAASELDLASGGVISSTTFSSGQGGSVSVSASSIVADGSGAMGGLATGIASDSDVGASGNGGTVAVNAGSLTLENGGTVGSASIGTGNGGAVNVTVGGEILIEGSNTKGASAITAASVGPGVGSAGTITISANNLTLLNGGLISTRADPLVADPTVFEGGGGNLIIHATQLVELTNSRITTSVAGGNGNGGNITIDPPFVILDNSEILAEAFGGNGGSITITTADLIETDDSLISASSTFGLSGTIVVETPGTDVTASIDELSGKFSETVKLTGAACATSAAAENDSSLTIGSTGGLPPIGDRSMAGNYFVDRAATEAERGSEHVQLARTEGSQLCW